MEICQQAIDMPNLHWRMNKNIGGTLLGDKTPLRVAPSRFQHAHGRGADCDDSLRGVDRCGGALRNGKRLAMHSVLGNVFHFYWLKRSGSNVQGDESVRQCREHFLGEVQSGGRRSNGSWHPRVNGLVTFEILGIALPAKIWWQRNHPALPRIDLTLQQKDSLPFRTNFFDAHRDAIDRGLRAHPHLAARANQALTPRHSEP